MIASCPRIPSLQLRSTFLPSNPLGLRSGVVCETKLLRRAWKKSSSRCCVKARPRPSIEGGVLRIHGAEATITCVPENVSVSTQFQDGSAFLGFSSDVNDSRHVFKLGILRNHRLVCLFRFKIWWMIPRMGNSASDIPVETQMLLLEAKKNVNAHEGNPDASTTYLLFLPVLDGQFRSSLQGNSSDELECCIESGDPAVEGSKFLEAVFINYGSNPFELMKESMKTLEKHKGTFRVRESKKKPGILDCFGWCTWDAFYFDVNPEGIEEGLKSLSKGGTPPKFLIIDDGWQDTTANDFQESYGERLVSVKENSKFRKRTNASGHVQTSSLKDFVASIKSAFGLKYVYVWHALMGYWGGVSTNAPETKKYNSKITYPVQSPGNLSHSRDMTMDLMEKYGVDMVDPDKAFEFYDDLHSYLRSQGVDGVKVDVQNLPETLGARNGGRVSLTQSFQQALEQSISKNFDDNGIICCMAHSNDSTYSSKVSAITRVSDDYWPRRPSSQTLHIASVAFNSIFLGEVVVPDWDMFYSLHYAAEFHATARALGGCGIYVSDKPNQHDFEVLKKLVLPDGTILRAKYPGRPTRDCLFNDPVMDGKSLLKIWNLNDHTGVLGVFNCQGAGSWPCLDKEQSAPSDSSEAASLTLTGQISPGDVEYLQEVAGDGWAGDCAIYSHNAGILSRLPKSRSFDVTLKVLQCEVFTISPIKVCDERIEFAPIGLIKMYNSGGAVQKMEFIKGNDAARRSVIRIRGRGSGLFGAYSNKRPLECSVNSTKEGFQLDSESNLLTIQIPTGTNSWTLHVTYEA